MSISDCARAEEDEMGSPKSERETITSRDFLATDIVSSHCELHAIDFTYNELHC